MNAKRKQALFTTSLAALILTGGCTTIPEGYTVAVEGDHVLWDSMGQPRLARLVPSEAPRESVATTTGEFPGHPIQGVWSAPAKVVAQAANGGYPAEYEFVRELARSDGGAADDPVLTPSETTVASR